MRSSYKSEDVTVLLKDFTGLVEPLPASVQGQELVVVPQEPELVQVVVALLPQG